MRQKEKLTRLLKSALLLLAFCLFAMTCTGVGTAEAAPQQITMSFAQWNQFKEQTNLLEAKLNLVDEKLKQQKGTSSELLMQLAEAKKQLGLTQQALTNSKRSLVNAKESLRISESLYEKLKLQMESERQKAKRVKRQRNLYAGCVIFAVVYAAAK
nr:MAG TPA: Peptidoglycan endopeptidase [Caudoviricetes sp.]